MTQQRFEMSQGIAYTIPYGVVVHLQVGDDYVGGIAHEYRITIDRETDRKTSECWIVALEFTLPSGPVRARRIKASSKASAVEIKEGIRAEMRQAFATVGTGVDL